MNHRYKNEEERRRKRMIQYVCFQRANFEMELWSHEYHTLGNHYLQFKVFYSVK